MRLWQKAEEDAVGVFAANLRDLLLAAPAGARATMGLDPGFRTGVKVAVVDATGKAVATETIYPHDLKRRSAAPGPGKPAGWEPSIAVLARLAAAHGVDLIAIGNGTASRETDRLAADLIKAHPELKLTKIVVSEAGASVYSASEYASRELPGMDVSLRGAVSIARRLQDPLAELVKIDPKSIGVGQYQHDLSEGKLSRSLDAVVEDCVNAVGVDVNTASAPLLARVSGIGEGLAGAIVAQRDADGPFRTRQALTKVPRLGPKAFEQCAGFLRITDGDDPLDASSVHPEAYPVVERILTTAGSAMPELIGNTAVLRALKPQEFTDDQFGLPTVTDILEELEKPGRDPRPAFTTASFAEGIETLEDLAPGMVLEGVVTNVAAFGAFVDIGVHQDGLVHVSAMSRSFVSDPREVVKSGDVVRVKVLGVDVPRKRISLTLRLDDEAAGEGGGRSAGGDRRARVRVGRAAAGARRTAGTGRARQPLADRAEPASPMLALAAPASPARTAPPRRTAPPARTAPAPMWAVAERATAGAARTGAAAAARAAAITGAVEMPGAVETASGVETAGAVPTATAGAEPTAGAVETAGAARTAAGATAGVAKEPEAVRTAADGMADAGETVAVVATTVAATPAAARWPRLCAAPA